MAGLNITITPDQHCEIHDYNKVNPLFHERNNSKISHDIMVNGDTKCAVTANVRKQSTKSEVTK